MVALILFYLFFPAVILFLTHKFSAMNKIGSVLIAYFFGLVIGNSALMPDHVRELQKNFSEISVLLALPLLLFSANIKAWLHVAGKTMLSGLLVTISVLIVVVSGYFIFVKDIPEGWKVAGLLTGVYTGGTPNMAAIKTALNVTPDMFIVTHTYDMLVCTIFLLMAMTIFQRFGLMFLPAFKSNSKIDVEKEVEKAEELESYVGILNKENRLPLLKSFGLSVKIGRASCRERV